MLLRRLFVLSIVSVVCFFAAAPAFADKIITKSGDIYEGYIVRETDKEIVINYQNMAEITIKKADIIQHIKADKTTEAGTAKDTGGATSEPGKSTPPAVSGGRKAPAKKAPATRKPVKRTAARTPAKKAPAKTPPKQKTTTTTPPPEDTGKNTQDSSKDTENKEKPAE